MELALKYLHGYIDAARRTTAGLLDLRSLRG